MHEDNNSKEYGILQGLFGIHGEQGFLYKDEFITRMQQEACCWIFDVDSICKRLDALNVQRSRGLQLVQQESQQHQQPQITRESKMLESVSTLEPYMFKMKSY